MITGAHNTMTSKTPKQWWLRPFKYMAKCQSKTIELLLESGVRCFDLRIRFSKGIPYFCHGIMKYKGDLQLVLNTLSKYDNVYVRIGYENIFNSKDYNQFIFHCHNLVERYPTIKFQICKKKPNWTIIENYFDKDLVEIQTVPTWKNVWLGPKYLTKYLDCSPYIDKDIIVLMDFI